MVNCIYVLICDFKIDKNVVLLIGLQMTALFGLGLSRYMIIFYQYFMIVTIHSYVAIYNFVPTYDF